MPDSPYQLRVSTRAYTGFLLALVAFFVVAHTALNLYSNRVDELPWLLIQLFHLDEESNFPTWFSSFLLLNNAFFLYLYAKTFTSRNKVYWTAMSVGFFFLAVEEVAGLHETLNSAIEMNWAIPGAIIFAIVATAFVPFLLSLRRGLAVLLIFSGFLYVSGAIIVELLSEDMDSDSSRYALAVAVEEGLEMLGALLCLTIVLNEMKKTDTIVANVSLD